MKYLRSRFFFSSLFFLLGLGILLVSLMTVGGVLAGDGSMTEMRFYSGEVLPDHVAYPAIMAMDRFYLETASPVERIYMQIEYANRRLYYSKALLEREERKNPDLALTTLTKAEKYVLAAAQETLALDSAPTSVTDLSKRSLQYHIDALEKMTLQFPDFQRSVLDQLREEEKALLAQFE